MIGVLHAVPHRQGRDTGQFRESTIILRCNLPSPLQPARKFAQLAQSKGTLYVAQSVIEAEVGHFIKPRPCRLALAMVRRDAVVAELPHPSRQLSIIRGYHAPFAGGYVLDGVETERAQVRQR